MDSTTFHKDLRNLFADLAIPDETLTVAEKVAFLKMAHHIDLPDAEDSGSFSVTSGTPNYSLSLSSGKDIDRITSAVFVASTTKQPLEEWNIREYQFAYRGVATSGVPYAYCYYNDQMWLYYIPNVSGTVYFTCQHVITDLTDFPDNYYPLMVELVKTQIYKPGSAEWYSAYRASNALIKSFKKRMHPIKSGMEKTTYRSKRIQDLNSEI